VEQFVSFAGNVAQAYPEVLDAIDSDALIDNYADYLGIEGNILRGQDAREELRARRAEQQARAQQAQEALANVQATKDLGSARTDNTALGAILGGMAGAIEGGG
jgi:hypothetical protein